MMSPQEDVVWIKDLDFKQVDKDIIVAKEGILSDRHIYAAHKLLHRQFPKFEGFYSTLLVQRHSVTSDHCSGMCVNRNMANKLIMLPLQIFFVVERHHWVTTALIDGDVHLYDSSFQGQLTASVELQIAQMYQPLIAQHGLLLTVVPMQQQEEGSNNCGLFSIAAAYHAAKRDNIAAITFNESRMRSHLVHCFEHQLSPSPGKSVKQLQHTHICISIYCGQTRLMK